MKEKTEQVLCKIYFFLWSSSRRITYILHWFRDIYRRYFLRNIPIISLANYKEKIEIYTKYLGKKSNWVGCKYLRLHRWISQVGSVHFARKGWFFKVIRMVRKWNLNYEVAHVCLQVVSQLRNFRSTWCTCLQTAITSSFHFWFAHCLKCWTPDFLSFEMMYSMYKMDSSKCSKCFL